MGDNARSYQPAAFGIAALVFWWAGGLFLALTGLAAVFGAPRSLAVLFAALIGLMLLLWSGRQWALWLKVEEKALHAITLGGPRGIGWNRIGSAVFWTDPDTYQRNAPWFRSGRRGGVPRTDPRCDGVVFVVTGQLGPDRLLAVDEHMLRDARLAAVAICDRAGIEMPAVWVPPIRSRLAQLRVLLVPWALTVSALFGWGVWQGLRLCLLPPSHDFGHPLVRLWVGLGTIALAGAIVGIWTVVWEVFSHARAGEGPGEPSEGV